MNKISLPFTIRHDFLMTHPGIEGLMVFDGEVLLLHYQTRNPITAAINSDIIILVNSSLFYKPISLNQGNPYISFDP